MSFHTGSLRFGWRALDYTVANLYQAIVCLPGTWTQAQLDAECASGRVTEYVRDNHEGFLHNNAFLSKYWDPTITRWMRIVGPTSSTASVAMRDNYWGTTTTDLIDHAIVDYYDNFTPASGWRSDTARASRLGRPSS